MRRKPEGYDDMTHEELLLLIDTNSGGYLSKGNFVPLDEEVLGFVYALRAVVELPLADLESSENLEAYGWNRAILAMRAIVEKELK